MDPAGGGGDPGGNGHELAPEGRGGRLRQRRRPGQGRCGAGEVEGHAGADQPGGVGGEHPEGRCANAEAVRSAWTFSMIACRRWVWSAATVSMVSASVVVKNAWKRQVSNSVSWPSLVFGFSSGMRRTIRRPVICSAFFLEVNAVKGTSATWALEIQVLVVWS